MQGGATERRGGEAEDAQPHRQGMNSDVGRIPKSTFDLGISR